MTEPPQGVKRVLVLGAATELGQEVVKQLTARRYAVMGTVQTDRHSESLRALGSTPMAVPQLTAQALNDLYAQHAPEVVLNLIPQRANTLLHDGHKWRGFADSLRGASSALVGAAAQGNGGPRVIQASYTFLYGDALGANEAHSLVAPSGDPVFAAAIEAEQAILDGVHNATVARLGYLYGPQSGDLRLYIRAFGLHRAYFAGASTHRADWLHMTDAATALVRLTEQPPQERVYNIVAGEASSFAAFMDHFAHLLGVRHPWHIPRWGWGLARVIIAKEQMELLRLATTATDERFRQEYGWQPHYPDYHEGLAETLRAWGRTPAQV